ncbi:MAG: ribonuclease HII [Candidatus Cloacimonetes bacterium HGW-Cloacimonetes-2]|jgi:ribonuclease HII|nr:MAG: ribonuclease HII [Candidatus Cloacimonetes bacterium HGW-Cloacimonetes-2]
MNRLLKNDLELCESSLVGIDEAGRGALAGPVVVAAVILSYTYPLDQLNDSKKICAKTRENLYELIMEDLVAFSIIEIDKAYIDEYNILEATMEGMRQAAKATARRNSLILIDGNSVPKDMVARAVVRGDSLHGCIAAASILAKVHRDRLMTAASEQYPDYGFERNKGYGTAEHLRAIEKFGPCPIHRMSFAPLSELSIWSRIKSS